MSSGLSAIAEDQGERMQGFLVAALGAFVGGLAGFLSSLLLTRQERRATITSELMATFFSDAFLAHRISISDLWYKFRAGEVAAEDIAGGFWFPGVSPHYIGDTFGTLNTHQHLTAYIGFIVRLDHEMTHRRLHRDEIRSAFGMQLHYADELLTRVAQATAAQAERHNALAPAWIEAVQRVHDALVVSTTSMNRR
ncbi:hypothetical protein [Nocardia sp. XZ_19_369]|uniref:hypothetical protein n=1 Tax=Nocardia sp. XZ_19_369 TaxID=2769487 RepID=UPI0018904208|nr:hypothetical protein [Nocardia sp. XZ_19_369]